VVHQRGGGSAAVTRAGLGRSAAGCAHAAPPAKAAPCSATPIFPSWPAADWGRRAPCTSSGYSNGRDAHAIALGGLLAPTRARPHYSPRSPTGSQSLREGKRAAAAGTVRPPRNLTLRWHERCPCVRRGCVRAPRGATRGCSWCSRAPPRQKSSVRQRAVATWNRCCVRNVLSRRNSTQSRAWPLPDTGGGASSC
jgi:hypothetical protein